MVSIGEKFHDETSLGDDGYRSRQVHYGEDVPEYKTYPDAPKIKLPPPTPGGVTVERAINTRRSVRSFTNQSLTPGQVSQLLLSADGITYAEGGLTLRAAPSGGALYPVETYLFVKDVASIDDGLYHFQVSDSSLELVATGDFTRELHRAAIEQSAVGASPVTIVLTARFDRSTRKYADRGYRYTYLEAGAICENICLQAVSLGLGTVVMGAFNDDALNRLLGLEGSREVALLILPVGVAR